MQIINKCHEVWDGVIMVMFGGTPWGKELGGKARLEH